MTQEHITLIDRALDGNLSKEDFIKLQSLLRNDPSAMQHYCEQSEIHGYLEWELKEKNTALPPHTPPLPTRNRKSKPLILLSTAGCLTIALLALLFKPPRTASPLTERSPSPPIASPEVTAPLKEHPAAPRENETIPHTTLARITNTQSALWKNDQLKLGTWLKAGTYELLGGNAEITFYSGARVILQGPASIEALSPHLARLNSGQGVVHIPSQAQGFRLETPTNQFTDDDCSFALAVEDHATEVHVIKGTVLADHEQRLAADDSARLPNGSDPEKSTGLALLSLNRELPAHDGFSETQYLRWSFDSTHLGSFLENGNHPDQAFHAEITRSSPDAPEAEATTVMGKFNRALRLNGKGTVLSTSFPGISGTKERTICAWIRIPKIKTPSLHGYSLISWGDARRSNGKKWQIAWNSLHPHVGAPGALRTEFGGGHVIGTTDLRDNQWHHIASVYMGGPGNVADQVLHYIDGKLEAVSDSKHIPINTQTTSAETSLTYIGRRMEHAPRPDTFLGDIDELYIFPSALTPSQIEDLRLYNRPPRQVIQSWASSK